MYVNFDVSMTTAIKMMETISTFILRNFGGCII